MPSQMRPPFKIRDSGEAFWIEDSGGRRFAYHYYRDAPIIGTDPSGRLSRELALATVKQIARLMTDAGKRA